MAKERDETPDVNPFASIFGGNTGLTYEDLKRRRAIATALAARQRGFPKNIGEGLTYFGESLGEAIGEWRLRQMEEKSAGANADLRRPAPEDTTPPTYTRPTETPTEPATPATPAPGASVFPEPDAPAVAAVEPPMEPDAVGASDIPPSATAFAVPRPTESFRRPPEPEPPPESDPYVPVSEPSPLNARAAALAQPDGWQPQAAPQTAEMPMPQPRPAGADMMAMPRPRPPEADMMAMPRPRPAEADAPPPTGYAYTGKALPPAWEAAIARQPPELQPYLRQMALKETGLREGVVSSTGAAGPLQFTRGTGRQYGLMGPGGDRRGDPDAAFDAGTRLTQANAAGLRKALGREPTYQDLAGAHQQGLGGYTALTQGRLPPGRNLAVNNLPGAPQAALAKLHAYYGFPPGVGPSGGGTSTAVAGRPPEADPATVMQGQPRVAEAEPLATPDMRDAITEALMQQPKPQPQAAASEEDVAGEARLRDVLGGGRRPGSPFTPRTASRGDIGSDAPLPGLSPIGSATGAGIADTVQQRQRIYDAVQQQGPGVPQPDPTQAAGTPPVLPSSPASIGSDPVRLAQAMQPGIRPDAAGGWYQPPPPPAATPTDIKPAPDMPPSREAIPPASDEAPIVVPPERPRPPLRGPNERELYWLNVARDPRANEQTKLYATDMAARHAKWREAVQTQEQEEYKNYREKREQLLDARNKQVREEGDRRLKQQTARTDLELKQAQASVAPLEAKVKEADLALKEAQVRAIPNEVMKAELALKQAQATLAETEQRVAAGRAPPREKIGDQLLERQADGTWKDVTPGTVIGNIKLTEQQARGVKFFERSNLARKQGGDFAAMAGLKDSITGMAPIGGNYWVSSEYQIQNNAAESWIESNLRDISGASIRVEEYPALKRQYFPQPGDGPEQLKIKADRRLNAERSLYDSLGTAKPIADKYLADEKSKEDNAARDWLKSNPDHPSAAKVRQRLEGR